MFDPSHSTPARWQIAHSLRIENDACRTVLRTALALYFSSDNESDDYLRPPNALHLVRASA